MPGRDEVVQTFQRDTQATKNEYAQAKKQIDDQFKKDQRRAKKAKEEAGWQALAFFEGSRDEGIKWRRGDRGQVGRRAIDELHVKQEDGRLRPQAVRQARGSPSGSRRGSGGRSRLRRAPAASVHCDPPDRGRVAGHGRRGEQPRAEDQPADDPLAEPSEDHDSHRGGS